MKLDALFRAAALLSILVAGSCSVANDGTTISEDGASNHPITVEPSYREMKVQFAGGEQGVSADDAVKFDAFLADYRAHGNGSLGISVPNGAPSHAAITEWLLQGFPIKSLKDWERLRDGIPRADVPAIALAG